MYSVEFDPSKHCKEIDTMLQNLDLTTVNKITDVSFSVSASELPTVLSVLQNKCVCIISIRNEAPPPLDSH